MSEQLRRGRIHSLPPAFYYIPNFITAEEEENLLAKINSTSRWTQLSHRRLQVYPCVLSAKNVLLAKPLPQWLSEPLLQRFQQLGVFTSGEAESEVDRDTQDGGHTGDKKSEPTPSFSLGTPHKAPNHVLINEYLPGQGIMPHEDGDAYAPVVATISLGGHTVLEIFDKDKIGTGDHTSRQIEDISANGNQSEHRDVNTAGGKHQPLHRILQEPRSLLVTRGQAYRAFLHGIANIEVDEGLNETSIINWHMLGDKTPYECGSANRQTRVSLTFRDVLKVSRLGNTLFGTR